MNVYDYLETLHRELKLPRAQHSMPKLREAYSRGLGSLIACMQKHTLVNCKMTLARVNFGRRDVPAWIVPPRIMPTYGTSDFEQSLFTLYVRKTFEARVSFEGLVFCLAHELAHIVMYSAQSSLRTDEKATDICAMMLGYEHCALQRNKIKADVIDPWKELAALLSGAAYKEVYGYLSDVECRQAVEWIQVRRNTMVA